MIRELREKFITLLNTIFVKEDPIILAVINREMIRYKTSSDRLYKQSSGSAQLAKISTVQLDTSLTEILQNIIPSDWK